jgi:hypothetical protein
MDVKTVLNEVIKKHCHFIHNNRLNALLDVAEGLRYSQNLSLSAIGRNLSGDSKVKHKIKKVDRCIGNKHLYNEVDSLYSALSYFIFEFIKHSNDDSVVIDLCYLKDDRMVQMLSAQFCTRGMSLPLYQDVFEEGELKGRTVEFLNKLKSIIADGKRVIVIMDAGFHIEWFKEIEKQGWSWVCRVRQGKDLKLAKNEDWISVENFMASIGSKTMECGTILLTKAHKYSCRMVTTCKVPKGRVQKVSRNRTRRKTANGSYNKAAKEPWILVTNLSSDEYKGAEIVRLYSKRMQIEETFRVIKSHQFGLGGRYIRTLDVNRWGVLMLLSAIVIITYWVIGVVGYSQGMQRIFQPNTVKDKKIYSYFTLGKFIIEFNYLHAIKPLVEPLASIIKTELCRA